MPRSKKGYETLDKKMDERLEEIFLARGEPDWIYTSDCYSGAKLIIIEEELEGVDVYYWCKTMHKYTGFVKKQFQVHRNDCLPGYEPSRSPIF